MRPHALRLALVSALAIAGVALAVLPLISSHDAHAGVPAAAWSTRSVPVVESHGDGPVLAAATSGGSTYTDAPARPVTCVRGSSAPAFQVVYAYPRDAGNRRSSAIRTIRRAMAQANGIIYKSARETAPGSDVRLRVRCNRYQAISVATYAFSKAGADGRGETFRQIITAGRKAGFRSGASKYVVFWDSGISGMCGQAEMHLDTSRSVANANNTGNNYAVVYGRTCWTGTSTMHELGHTMGAVQNDAPHATGTAHCNQEQDVMCYADGGPSGRTSNLRYSCARIVRFDCGHDDYFRVGRTSGYLATHWQVGWVGNRFLSFRGTL
ncbi:MAG: hypothetical protein J7518_18835 [Nocardioidaceae bacterium]|nr:hypothetical protein [Nocardioidaceae bacterium]